MKNKEKIQLLEHRLNTHSELLERIISKLEFDDVDKPELMQLDQDIFIDLDSKWIFAAIDKNGSVWVYTHKPFVDSNYWYVEDLEGTEIGQGYDTLNWQTSLIKRETFELTGNELCKAMLARGDKYIMCLVGTHNDVVVIEGMHGNEFVAVGMRNLYHNPKPINNQGEPLTSSDVDL